MSVPDPLTPDQLEPCARAMLAADGQPVWEEARRDVKETVLKLADAAITAAIKHGLVVRAEERDWQAFPARQLTGKPYVYHAYVGRIRPEQTCGHDHRSPRRAEECAQKMARDLNGCADPDHQTVLEFLRSDEAVEAGASVLAAAWEGHADVHPDDGDRDIARSILDALLAALPPVQPPERADPPSEDEPDEREETPCASHTPATSPPGDNETSNPAPSSEQGPPFQQTYSRVHSTVAGREACPRCGGSGRLHPVPALPVGSTETLPCGRCHGTGTVSTDKEGCWR